MRIGVPREIKTHEYRVGLVPESVRALSARGHEVLVESGAGIGIGAPDDEYVAAGARIVPGAEDVFAAAEMIVKVKEPQAPERSRLLAGQVLFTYLHLAPDPDQVRDLMHSGVVAIAYETVTSADGTLPLLAPMSAVAGRMSIQVAAHFLERPQGGRGVLMSGVPGAPPASVVVLGAGVVGYNAVDVAIGMGAEVTVLDCSATKLAFLKRQFAERVRIFEATATTIADVVMRADAVIGAALVPGALAPKLVTRPTLASMRSGAVMVDVSIDQGGCFETSRPTTHAQPTFVVDGVLHYCVANMPGAVPRTSAMALNHATLPFVMEIADLGWHEAMRRNPHLMNGLNICKGQITNREVAGALGLDWSDPVAAIA